MTTLDEPSDAALDKKMNTLVDEFDDFMNDDFNTARVLANMFEIVPVINSLKDGIVEKNSISSATLTRMKDGFTNYIENILGLQSISQNNETLNGVMQLLADIRKGCEVKKRFFNFGQDKETAFGTRYRNER